VKEDRRKYNKHGKPPRREVEKEQAAKYSLQNQQGWSTRTFEENPLGLPPKLIPKMSKGKLELYGRHFGPKLKGLMEKCYEEIRHTDVREELALIRTVNLQRAMLLNATLETKFPDTPDGQQMQRAAIELAGNIVFSSSSDVIAVVEKVAKIDALAASVVSPFAIEGLTRQISRFVHNIFDDDPIYPDDAPDVVNRKLEAQERMVKFERAMDEELELPQLQGLAGAAKGTKITPDQQVLAMDAMIPTSPPVVEEIED
jgi:hypothetical protein